MICAKCGKRNFDAGVYDIIQECYFCYDCIKIKCWEFWK